jgi:amino acid transporter
VLKLLPLAALLIAWAIASPVASDASVSSSGVTDPGIGAGAVLRAGLIVLFPLQGFEIVPVPAGHVRNPNAIPRATLAALGVAAIVYFGLHLACVRALPALAASKAPLADAARVWGGPALARLLAVGTSVSALGISLGMIAMTPRYLAALGRSDGLGEWVGGRSRRGVPLRALLLTGGAVLACVQIGSLDELFALSSIAVLAQYGATAASLAVLGARRERGLDPRHAALGLVALLAALLVAAGASLAELARAAAVVVGGLAVKLVVQLRARRAYADGTDKPEGTR